MARVPTGITVIPTPDNFRSESDTKDYVGSDRILWASFDLGSFIAKMNHSADRYGDIL